MDTPRRIVVTGLGALSSVGLNPEETFANLLEGKSGIGPITLFDASPQAVRIAGEVKNFNPTDYLDRKLARRTGRYIHFAVAAARQAVAQAGLDPEHEQPERVGVLVASAIGDFPMIEEQMKTFHAVGPGRMNPFTTPRVSSSMGSGFVSMLFGFHGPNFGTSSACATGNHALATAALILQAGHADVMLAGGVEAALSPAFVESYIALRGLSQRNDEPERASRPFDRDRDGFVIAEGGAVLVLETLEHAKRRGATILAELSGFGMTSDAYHMTAPHPEGKGAALAIRQALKSARISPEDVDYVSAHGTGTPLNDPVETKAIKTALGERAYSVPISSIKSMIGHAIAGAGALEAVVSVLAIQKGVIPPTINLDNPDPECDLDYVPWVAREVPVRTVLSNSFGFGGQNCVLVFKKFEE